MIFRNIFKKLSLAAFDENLIMIGAENEMRGGLKH